MKTFNHIKLAKKKVFITAGLLIVIIYGCKSYKVINSDYDTSADFSSYHTFAWLPDKDNESTQEHDSIIHNNIKNYFSRHFVDFGYSTNTVNPDLLFEQVITTSNKKRTYIEQRRIPPNYNYQRSPYYSPTPNPYGYKNSNSYNYNYKKQNYLGNKAYYYRPRAPQYRSETLTEEYVESTFTLNAIDRKKNKLVWTCTVQANIYSGSYNKSGIHPAIHSILKTYPRKKIVK